LLIFYNRYKMIDFIPLEYYTELYYQFIMVVCLFTLLHTYMLKGDEDLVYNFNNIASSLLLIVLLLFIGLRPISGKYFADMGTYAETFFQFQNGKEISTEGDIFFEIFLKISSSYLSVDAFFFICAFIYIVPLLVASKNWFPKYYFFSFLLLITSLSFFAYGTNGIRNGMATSLFILALSYANINRTKMVLFFLFSVSFHKSMMLPLLAYSVTYFFKDTVKYYAFWFISILLSLTMGSFWIMLFSSIGFGDDRFTNYVAAGSNSGTSFRFDFVLYSCAPLVLAYIYIFKRGFISEEYNRLLHTYIVANAFWIMIIRASFSNRFAYLSWFLMAIIVGYPLLKELIFEKQFKRVGLTVLFYYCFTFGMFYYYQFR